MDSLFRPRLAHYAPHFDTATISEKSTLAFQETMSLQDQHDEMDSPPSYESLDGTVHLPKTVSTLALEQVDSFFMEQPLPPTTNYFVRSSKPPSPWKLLSGLAISNATTELNPERTRKRRYRIIYPPNFEDVYLHKSLFTSNTTSLPTYHIELFGRKTYKAEPITILGPMNHDPNLTNEALNLALANVPKVFQRIEDEISKTTRYATFCEMEFFSWDWKCKTEAARGDMRHLIDKGKARCVEGEGLCEGLGKFLEFVDLQEQRGIYYEGVVRGLRGKVKEAGRRLDRLRV